MRLLVQQSEVVLSGNPESFDDTLYNSNVNCTAAPWNRLYLCHLTLGTRKTHLQPNIYIFGPCGLQFCVTYNPRWIIKSYIQMLLVKEEIFIGRENRYPHPYGDGAD